MRIVSLMLVCALLQSINQPINALIDPSISQSMVRSPNQFSLPLTLESTHQVIIQSNNQRISQSIDQSINHSDDQSISQSRFNLNQYEESVAILSGCSNVAFSAPVYINNQGPFKLIVDTGSTTLSVASMTCANCSSLSVNERFNTSGLSTVIDSGDVYVAYADTSSWSGAGYYGNVAVGDPDLGGSVAVGMVFATIEQQTKFLKESQCGVFQTKKNWHSGIIGFAYPGLGSKGTDAWFSNYVDQTGVANEFTLQMCVTPSGETSGNLWVGAYDKSYVASQFVYVPIVKRNHYNTFLNRIYLTTQSASQDQSANQGVDLGFTTADYGPCNDGTGDVNCAIVDSGTTYMSFPTPVLNKMVAAIIAHPDYQRWIPAGSDPLSTRNCYPESNYPPFDVLNANLPALNFVFGETAVGARPVTIKLEPMNGYLVISYDGSGRKYYCPGLGSTGDNAAILGYSFMNQFTIRHDIGNNRMGFARTRQCGVAAPIMPNLAWSASAWGDCDAACGGFQWRHVNCTDIFGGVRADVECFNGFAGPKPEVGRPCGDNFCPLVNSTRVVDVSINPSITQLTAGTSIDISFMFTGSPSHVQLYLQPINNVNKWPYIITKNASFVRIPSSNPSLTQTGSYRWVVPAALPAGQYVLGGFTQVARYEYLAPSNRAVTMIGSNNLALGDSVCGSDGANGSPVCSNHGRCTVSSTNQPICTCIAGYSGPYCNVSTINTCSIQCSNEGVGDVQGCTCKCPNQFSGVLCEYRYATVTAVLTIDPLTVDGLAPGKNHQMFKAGFISDIAQAAGVPHTDISVLSVFPSGPRGARTAVTFTFALPADNTDLRNHVSFLNSLAVVPDRWETGPVFSSLSSLSSGLFSQYITVMLAVNFPPDEFKLSDPTGDDVIVTLTNHLTLIIGIAAGICGGLMSICVGCLCFQRRELKKALSSSEFRRRESVVKRVEEINGAPAQTIRLQVL